MDKSYNRNNKPVLASWYPVLWEKIGPTLPPLVGLMAGREAVRPADKIRVDFEIVKLLYRLHYSGFYFV